MEVVVVSSSGPEINDIVYDEGVRHEVIPFTRQITPWKDLLSVFLLIKLIKKERPDIVHSHTPKAGLVAMIAAWFCKVPVRMHTVAGLPLMESTGGKRKILIAVERLTYRCATMVYPNSFVLKKYIVDHLYSNHKKLKVIANGSSNGIDCGYFCPSLELQTLAESVRESLGISQTDKVAVFVGRITGDKGINELVTVFKELNKLHLILVGMMEVELDPLATDVVKEINENPRIHPVGFQPDVRPYLLASNFLVFPSYREGFPNVPMQAGAMGLPSIVTDINGCNEIVVHKENGLLIAPKSIRELKEAMEVMLTDHGLFEHMRSKSRPMITDRFDQCLVWEALEQEYKTLANEKRV